MPGPGISAIIPVYNRASMVREALDSVARQTRPADEIILVDDGSDDGSAEAAQAFENIQVIRQENRGISAARNAGIDRARGKFLAFLDSDDLWHRDKLRLQERFMTAHPEIPLCHTHETWIRDSKQVNQKNYHRKEGGFLFHRSLERCLISPSAVMIRRDLFPIVGRFDENLPVCEDYDLWLRITSRYPVGYIDEALTIKRGGHEDQLSRKLKAMDLYRLAALEKVVRHERLAWSVRQAAMAMFRKKAEILTQGYLRRAREEEARKLTEKTACLTRISLDSHKD